MFSEAFVCPRGKGCVSVSREISVQGHLCPGGVSVQRWVCVQRETLCQGGLCLWGSPSRKVSVTETPLRLKSGWQACYWSEFLLLWNYDSSKISICFSRAKRCKHFPTITFSLFRIRFSVFHVWFSLSVAHSWLFGIMFMMPGWWYVGYKFNPQ